MAKKAADPIVPELHAVFRSGKKTEIIPAWRYYTLVIELQFAGLPSGLSYDTAKQITRLKDEEIIDVGDLSIRVERRFF